MNSYELSRAWFNYCFDNPEKIKPNHTALYFFAIEHCNRLGWKDKFGLPSQMVMEAIGIKNWRTYSSALNDLIEFGFIKMIQVSKNQYSSNIIAIVKNTKAPTKALDKALHNHSTKQSHSIVSIDKQYNKETIKQLNNNASLVVLNLSKWIESEKENKPKGNNKEIKEKLFISFWELYDKKTGKERVRDKFLKLSEEVIAEIIKVVPYYVNSTPDKKFRKNPLTYLNGKHWKDEIEKEDQTVEKETINFDKLLLFINKQTGKKYEVFNSDAKNEYKARLKDGYKPSDIANAITNAVNDVYHKSTDYKYLTLEFFSRSTILDKYGFKTIAKKTGVADLENFVSNPYRE